MIVSYLCNCFLIHILLDFMYCTTKFRKSHKLSITRLNLNTQINCGFYFLRSLFVFEFVFSQVSVCFWIFFCQKPSLTMSQCSVRVLSSGWSPPPPRAPVPVWGREVVGDILIGGLCAGISLYLHREPSGIVGASLWTHRETSGIVGVSVGRGQTKIAIIPLFLDEVRKNV